MKPKWYWIGLIILIFLFFKHAFNIGFFKDDLYFLNISQTNSWQDFLNFFNPLMVRGGGFRPISTQLFYFFIDTLNLNHFQIHLIMFITYIIGLIILHKIIVKISRNIVLANITVLVYGLSFIHVFQLYTACTFQEICLFTFLSFSFYSLLQQKEKLSFLFFVLALASKEYAVFYPFLIWIIFLGQKQIKNLSSIKVSKIYLLVISLTALTLGLLLKYQLSDFARNPLYAIHLEPRLIVNNLMWLSFWSIGFPIYLPDYLPSIFGPPLPDFYKALVTSESRIYWLFLLIFLGLFLLSSIYLFVSQKTKRKEFIYLIIFTAFNFTLFNLPTLPTIHKTMIRLMIPLVFVAILQGYVITRLYQQKGKARIVAIFMIITYLVFNYYGTIIHESASTFKLESDIYFHSKQYFENRRSQILKKDTIYIKDLKKGVNPWGGSKKLKDTYWDQNFVQYLFPEKKLTMIYGFEQPNIPKKAYVVSSLDLLLYRK